MKSKSRILLISTIIIFILAIFIGTSYSLWQTINTQDSVNTATTKCFNVEITSQKNSISLENAYPITNEKGKKLTPFSFTITNTCDIFASYTVSLESLKGTTLSSKFLNAMINHEEIKKLSDYEVTDTVNTGSIESHILAKGSLGSEDSEDYTLRVWIDYDTTMEDLDNETKTFKSKIIVKAEPSSWSPVDEGYTTLHDAILANEYQTSPEMAIKKIEAKGTPDFSQTAPIITWNIKKNTSDVYTTVTTPHPDIVGKKDLGTEDLNEENILLILGTSFQFNQTTGNYNLSNMIKTDPSTLDLVNNDYYYCNAGTNYDDVNKKLTFWQTATNCSSILRLKKVSKRSSGTQNTSGYSLKYDLVGNTLTQEEVESDKSDTGLYKAKDDYGISYYYRGNVKNNIVKFANFYWKIIKINGDNSIRLLYAGSKSDLENNTTKAIGRAEFNHNYKLVSSIGYMYGKNDTSREDIVKNEVDSDVKKFLDNWYEKNLLNYSYYISDNGFCNDRSIYDGDGYSSNNTTFYGAYAILSSNSPSYNCPNITNDLFTTKNSTIGNKALTYPIGIMTVDEITFAGYSRQKLNTLNFMYSIDWAWTMSPYISSSLSSVNYSAFKYIGTNWVKCNFLIRPVISLKSDVEISGGIGTVNDPFVVKTE